MAPGGREARKAEARRRRARRELAILGAVAGVVALLVAGAIVYATTRPTPPQAAARPIDGIPCEAEQSNYHEHAHLAIVSGGTSITIPVGIGINVDHGCYYWLHVHNPDGVIHMEAPHAFGPTLGMFFDVWGQPLSRRQVAGVAVGSSQAMRVYVGRQLFTGDPRSIPLRPHESLTIEVGPPFRPPVVYKFPPDY